MEITIATSLAPQNREVQRNALASWKRLGFHVISVNSSEEIKLIKDMFPDVTFVETERNASASLGKPYVYFDDVLRILESTGSPICGIINSDIHLIAGDDFLEFISKEAHGGFVFGSRVNVTSLSSLEGKEYVLGFDFFFFSREIIKEYMKTDFCLGVTWWDYWAPVVPILKKLSVKQLITPVAYHIQHPARWDRQQFLGFGTKFLNYLKQSGLYEGIGEDLIAAAEMRKDGPNIELFAILIADYINQQSSKISYHQNGLNQVDEMSSMLYPINEELAFQKNIHKQMYKTLIDMTMKLESNLSDIERSLWWRLGMPLRGIRNRFNTRSQSDLKRKPDNID